MATNMSEAIRKSINLVITEESGSIRRGKYTLVIMDWLLTRELLVSDNAVEKNCQNSNPVYTKIGYGTPSEGILTSSPKKTVNTTIVINGWNIAHATPINVCL
jgi:hypothetical protein